jgi:hypothetical protein
MAGEENTISVEVDAAGDIEVEVQSEITPEPDKKLVVQAEPERKQRSRVRVAPDPVAAQAVVAPVGPTPEQALEDAKAFAKRAEDALKAAEATAMQERARAEEAARRAEQLELQAQRERERADNHELVIIENGISAAQREVAAHEEAYTRAAEAGDFAKMAAINSKLSKANAALDRLEDAKSTFESSSKRSEGGRVEAPAPQAVPPSQAEQYLAQFAPTAQTWLRQHMDCLPPNLGGNQAKNSRMMQGHYEALAKNITPNTSEYFNLLDTFINPPAAAPAPEPAVSKAAEVVQAEAQPKPAPRVTPSAPVSRESPVSEGQPQRSTRSVRLTPQQQEMARVSYPHMSDAQAYGEYAKNLIELEKEGKMGRLTH